MGSVLKPTFRDFEIIIVDDASKDNTREVISQFDDSSIRYIGREISGGSSEASSEAPPSLLGKLHPNAGSSSVKKEF